MQRSVSAREVVLLSPHPDDAALSATGCLLRAIEAGQRVRIVVPFCRTNFSRLPGELSVELVSRLRKREDATFVALLGAAACVHWLDLPDAAIRPGVGLAAIFRDGPLDDAAERLATDLVTLLKPLMDGCSRLLVPLALGGHLDHRIVRLAGERLGRLLDVPIAFYEDMPYATQPPSDAEHIATQLQQQGMRPELIDCPELLQRKRRALACYGSQLDAGQIDGVIGYADGLRPGQGAERLWWPDQGQSQRMTAVDAH